MKNFIELKNVKKTYIVGEQKFNALNGIDLSINQGEFVVILGPSGAGKSTLIRTINRMIDITDGQLIVDGTESEDEYLEVYDVVLAGVPR